MSGESLPGSWPSHCVPFHLSNTSVIIAILPGTLTLARGISIQILDFTWQYISQCGDSKCHSYKRHKIISLQSFLCSHSYFLSVPHFLTQSRWQIVSSPKRPPYALGFLGSWSSQLPMMSSLLRWWLVSSQVCQVWNEISLLFLQVVPGERSICATNH